MDEFYSGSDIPFTLFGGDKFDLDRDNFDVWYYIYSNKIFKLAKGDMKRIAANTYEGIIKSEFTATMGVGYVTREIRIRDISHGTVNIVVEEKSFIVKKSLIGG